MKQGLITFAFISALTAPAALASSVTIDEFYSDVICAMSRPDRAPELNDFRYELNRELGRARLDMTFYTNCPSGSDELGLYDKKLLVSGLSFDAAASQVIYTSEGGAKVVCANVDFPRFLGIRRTRIRETGACGVSVRSEIVNLDDGFQIHRREKVIVSFEAQN